MKDKLNLKDFNWINQPVRYKLNEGQLSIHTQPETDLWQRTYYGFQNDNAPGFLAEIENDFTLLVKTKFNYKKLFDQCGVLLYQNSDNWIKASVEYENENYARLGSVVTNLGYSDWATTDIPADLSEMWYRFSRRGQDFYIEYSLDGKSFKQMRVIHMHEPIEVAKIGVYACSPLQSSFKAEFSDLKLGECEWELHN